MEMLPWDGWGLIEKPDKNLTTDEFTFLDHIAALTSDDVPEFDEVRGLYESIARLHVTPLITT